MIINTVEQLNTIISAGAYAWPGGYPLFFIAADSEPLAFSTVVGNREAVTAAFGDGGDPAWRPVAVEINWEDDDLHCAHTGKRIESAYGDD